MGQVARFEKRAGCAFLALALAQGSCSLVLDTGAQQCTTEADCKKRGGLFANSTCASNHVCVTRTPVDDGGPNPNADGGEPVDGSSDGGLDDAPSDPVWGCLGHVVMQMPQGPTVKVALPFWDLIRDVSVTDIAMSPCNKLDVMCSQPIAPPVGPGMDGFVRVDLRAGFDGYGQVLSTAIDDAGDADGGAPKWMPSMVFFNPPIVRDTTYDHIPLFTPEGIRLLAAVQGNTIDPSLGIAFVGIQDCSGKPAAGATWEPSRVDQSSRRFFYVNGLPDEAAIATDSTGLGGLVNAPLGTITIEAKVQATGKRIGTATMLVRPGFNSYTYLAPTP